MNWNELRRQIDLMTPEQREMDVIVIHGLTEIKDVDNAIWYNAGGQNHLGELNKPFGCIEHKAPYLTLT